MGYQGNKVKATNVDRTEMSERGKKITAMLTALEKEDNLTEWEQGFVNDISDWWLIKERNLSPAQYERLDTIYRKFN
jgi:hypothetical protein